MDPAEDRPRRTWTGAIWLTAAALAQTLVAARFAPGWLRPNMLLVVAVAHAFVAAPRRAQAVGFVAGLAADLLSCGPVGFHAALNLTAVWAVLSVRSVLFAQRAWMQAALAFSLSLTAGAAEALILWLGSPGLDLAACLTCAAESAGSSAALTPLIVLFMGGGRRRTMPMARFNPGVE
jgi:rod shape-determining protein MreD